jgi:hypothetical protein
MPITHELKTWPQYFERVNVGDKTFEVRRNDRNFQVGDFLCLREWDPTTEKYTGKVFHAVVTYIISGEQFGIMPGFVVMAIKDDNP